MGADNTYGEVNFNPDKKGKYRCLLCGRDKFTNKTAHNCNNGFRKRKIKWQK
jgi:hypothetical protein